MAAQAGLASIFSCVATNDGETTSRSVQSSAEGFSAHSIGLIGHKARAKHAKTQVSMAHVGQTR